MYLKLGEVEKLSEEEQVVLLDMTSRFFIDITNSVLLCKLHENKPPAIIFVCGIVTIYIELKALEYFGQSNTCQISQETLNISHHLVQQIKIIP